MEELIALAAVLGMGGDPAGTSVQLSIALSGDAERRTVRYECEGIEDLVAVQYVNAAPNFLALVPLGGHTIVFVNVVAADGARYVAGQYEWWSRGAEAGFSDATQPDAAPVRCFEHTETP
jgi:membrane-bound inhibitor of C-type lysozyme